MYFKVKKAGTEKDLIVNLSKTALIKDVRQFIYDRLTIEPAKQVLLYKGKQVINKITIIYIVLSQQ